MTAVDGQEKSKNFLGGHIAAGSGKWHSSNNALSRSYEGKTYFRIGIDYARRSDRVAFGTGLSVTSQSLDVTTNTYFGRENIRGTFEHAFFIFSIPAHMKMYFFKYFFFDGGFFFNYHPHFGYEWGVGPLAGAGVEYVSKQSISFALMFQMQWNLLFTEELAENLNQKGVSFSIGHRF
ncbi:MAG: hypothetical protein LBS03_01865 [Bacteroidales bacterium]|nr:hypothetical protein [Bacteroidales bacterium]